jgi:transcriptional regulator GlxA family with amidase domain
MGIVLPYQPSVTKLRNETEESILTRRVSIIEAQFLNRVRARPRDPIAAAAALLRLTLAGTRVNQLAASSGFSPRQFSRLFKERVGMPPKTYARVLRLNAAIEEKSANPEVSWAEIAQKSAISIRPIWMRTFLTSPMRILRRS